MPQTGKLMPNLDQQSTKLLNLTVLQRFDPCILDILFTAAHVALYEFSMGLNQWSRKDVQGALFVVKRNKDPWYQFIVMNQRNTENHVENLSGNFEFDVQVPYLLYKNVIQEVNGIWFYNTPECEEVADLFNRIIDSLLRSSSEPYASNKSEFKELEPVPSPAMMESPLEPSPGLSATSVNAAGATEIDSISNLFNAATNFSNSGKPVQTYHLASRGSSSLIPIPAPAAAPVPAGLLQSSSSAPTVHLIHHHDGSDSTYRSNQITNLVTPAIFHTPHSSSSAVSQSPVSSSLPPNTLQHPYGTPFLQPYPPPAPSPFLTPHSAAAPTHGPVIDRGKVREALLTLVQDNQFIDMVCKALQQVNQV